MIAGGLWIAVVMMRVSGLLQMVRGFGMRGRRTEDAFEGWDWVGHYGAPDETGYSHRLWCRKKAKHWLREGTIVVNWIE